MGSVHVDGAHVRWACFVQDRGEVHDRVGGFDLFEDVLRVRDVACECEDFVPVVLQAGDHGAADHAGGSRDKDVHAKNHRANVLMRFRGCFEYV